MRASVLARMHGIMLLEYFIRVLYHFSLPVKSGRLSSVPSVPTAPVPRRQNQFNTSGGRRRILSCSGRGSGGILSATDNLNP